MNPLRGGRKVEGRDYSKGTDELLPKIIATTPKTKHEIAREAGRHHATVTRVIEALQQSGGIHIAGWKRGIRGPITPLWKAGPGKDEPKPDPIPLTDRVAKYMATARGIATSKRLSKQWRQSERGKEYQASYNKARTGRRRFEKHGIAGIDPLLAAIMGVRK